MFDFDVYLCNFQLRKMSSKDHLGLYKSRTGNHSRLVTSRAGRTNQQLREKRANDRLNAHGSHRHIEPTPMKPALVSNRLANMDDEQCQRNHNPTDTKDVNNANTSNNNVHPKLSRQQEFRLRFHKYREMKAAKMTKKPGPVPFTSAVPSGRIVDINDRKYSRTAANVRAIPSKPSTAKKPMGAKKQTETISKSDKQTKFSPINTRSRKLNLLSPSQLPTPRRRSRKSFQNVEADVKSELTTPLQVSKNKKLSQSINKESTITKQLNLVQSTVMKNKHNPKFDEKIDSISPIEYDEEKKSITTTETKSPANAPVLMEQEIDLNTTPVTAEVLNISANYVSPFVTISRGSRGSRVREDEARNTKYTLNSRRSLLNESLEDRQNVEAANYFRQQMAKESFRLMALVNEWVKYKAEHIDVIPSEYVDLIDVAAGQTRLLTTNKFMQFSDLINKCERGDKGEQPVRPIDLEGFWGMVFIQVENCDKRFARLNELRSNDWKDPELKRIIKKPNKTTLNGVAKVNGFKAKSSRANSELSQLLKAARKQFTESKQLEAKKTILTTFLNESVEPISSPRRAAVRRSIWVVS